MRLRDLAARNMGKELARNNVSLVQSGRIIGIIRGILASAGGVEGLLTKIEELIAAFNAPKAAKTNAKPPE